MFLDRARTALRVVGVLASYIVACILPSIGIGWLVNALGSPVEDARTAAYMALVKLGSKHASRLIAIAKTGRNTASVLQVLGDSADERIIPDLEEFAASADTETASAARASIEAIKLRSSP